MRQRSAQVRHREQTERTLLCQRRGYRRQGSEIQVRSCTAYARYCMCDSLLHRCPRTAVIQSCNCAAETAPLGSLALWDFGQPMKQLTLSNTSTGPSWTPPESAWRCSCSAIFTCCCCFSPLRFQQPAHSDPTYASNAGCMMMHGFLLQVAEKFGSQQISRPWSKYSEGAPVALSA